MISHGTFSRSPVATDAHTPRANGLTSTDSTTTPTSVEGTNGDGLVHRSERLEFEAFKWGIATGFVLGLAVALAVFVLSVAVTS